MPSSSAKWAILLPLALAAASGAAAEDRCTGTLCDFYYGGSAPETAPAAPAAPTPITVPGTGYLGSMFGGGDPAQPAAPGATPSRVQIQGGGLLSRGGPDDHCTGTLCDFYYGTKTPWPEEAPAAQPATQTVATEPVDPDVAPPPSRSSGVAYVERREQPLCAPRAGDPWSCYRR